MTEINIQISKELKAFLAPEKIYDEPPENSYSIDEWAEILKVSRSTAKRRLWDAVRGGLMEELLVKASHGKKQYYREIKK